MEGHDVLLKSDFNFNLCSLDKFYVYIFHLLVNFELSLILEYASDLPLKMVLVAVVFNKIKILRALIVLTQLLLSRERSSNIKHAIKGDRTPPRGSHPTSCSTSKHIINDGMNFPTSHCPLYRCRWSVINGNLNIDKYVLFPIFCTNDQSMNSKFASLPHLRGTSLSVLELTPRPWSACLYRSERYWQNVGFLPRF